MIKKRTESQYFFCPKRSAHQKRNAVIQAVLEHGLLFSGQKPAPRPYWSPLGDLHAPIQTSYFIGPNNLHYLLFSEIGALLCHHPCCFPSQSQTLPGIGVGRPPSGQYCSDKHPRDFYIRVPPWSLVSHLHSNGFCRHGKRHKVSHRRTTTFSRPASRSKFPGRLFEGGRL